MSGINKAIVIGNLGRDPETRYTKDGKAVTNFSVATSESWKDKGSGQKREQTEWHNIVCFGRTAEVANEYLRKGSKVYIEGKLVTSSWEKDGVKRYKTEIHARDLQMLDKYQDAPDAKGIDTQEPRGEPGYDDRSPPAPLDDQPTHDYEDDIPF